VRGASARSDWIPRASRRRTCATCRTRPGGRARVAGQPRSTQNHHPSAWGFPFYVSARSYRAPRDDVDVVGVIAPRPRRGRRGRRTPLLQGTRRAAAAAVAVAVAARAHARSRGGGEWVVHGPRGEGGKGVVDVAGAVVGKGRDLDVKAVAGGLAAADAPLLRAALGLLARGARVHGAVEPAALRAHARAVAVDRQIPAAPCSVQRAGWHNEHAGCRVHARFRVQGGHDAR